MPPRTRFDHRGYFDAVYGRSAPFIRALAERFALAGKRVISVGAGTCAEEVLFAAAGAKVDCLEPNATFAQFARGEIARLAPEEAIAVYESRHQDFGTDTRYDLIFVSCPNDWMSGDFKRLVPDDYLRFLERHAAEDCVLVVRYWSGAYGPDVLRTRWFASALSARLRTASDFRLRELWRTRSDRYAMAVATRGNPTDHDGIALAGWADRFEEPSALIGRWPADAMVRPLGLERITPFGLTLRHMARKVRNEVRRRRRERRAKSTLGVR